ncbi:MAG: aspartate ammonia-lyase [Rhodospirillaceae bacterium]|nr:aspartate ammonia-lyase [Rhodospirillaceae bacterium]
MRIEADLLGEREVPGGVYYGIHTLRAIENFPITGTSIGAYPDFIVALASIKIAAAQANQKLGLLDERRSIAIIQAAEEIRAGGFHDQFLVDVIQGGAGTSSNMNANEVIANRALEMLGCLKGEYRHLHPNQHVNMSQSTNDVYPTAVKIATYRGLIRLIEAVSQLRTSFEGKAAEFADAIKMGRTQLQEAVPMTLGQEFTAYAVALAEEERQLQDAAILLCKVNLGATAIGTGINVHPAYPVEVTENLRYLTGVPIKLAKNLIEATQDCGALVYASGSLKRLALKLSKVASDLRLLSSGPRAGLGEINLPPRQAGSSIMPGKVNPVVPETINQIAFEVLGNDLTVSFAAEGGQLQLNAFEPIIAHSLFKSLQHLRSGCLLLAEACVDGITANRERMRDSVMQSTGIVTALNPFIGYVLATEIVQEALATNESVFDVVLAKKLLTREQLNEILEPSALTQPRASGGCRSSLPCAVS